MTCLRLPRFVILLPLVFSLQGCLVASAVDLAATTVFTAGKLVVKGTGAVIDAAIPDKDDKKQDQQAKPGQPSSADYQPTAPAQYTHAGTRLFSYYNRLQV